MNCIIKTLILKQGKKTYSNFTWKENRITLLNDCNSRLMQKIITLRTDRQNGLYDITSEVVSIINESKVKTGIASVYARGATTAIMIQENWDKSVQNDVICLLKKLIPSGIWEHDRRTIMGMPI